MRELRRGEREYTPRRAGGVSPLFCSTQLRGEDRGRTPPARQIQSPRVPLLGAFPMRLTFALALLFAPLAVAIAADDPWKLDDKFKAAKPEDLKDAETAPAPKGAIILFDGKDF